MKFFIPLLVCGALIASQASAQSTTGRVKVTGIRTGWNADQIAVTFSKAVPNPAGCSTPDGVILNASTPGYKQHYAAILAAMVAEKEIEVIVANTGCTVNRPVFWGVYVY